MKVVYLPNGHTVVEFSIPVFFSLFQGGRKSTFFKQARSYPMFPCHEEKIKWDDYGEFIRYVNRLLLICPQSLFQTESKCEVFTSHVDSPWNRGWGELGSGLLLSEGNSSFSNDGKDVWPTRDCVVTLRHALFLSLYLIWELFEMPVQFFICKSYNYDYCNILTPEVN